MVEDKFPERIQFVYRDALDNIAFVKKQEWVVAGYGLAVLAGLSTFAKQIAISTEMKEILTLLAFTVPMFGGAIMLTFWHGMAKWRLRLSYIYENYFDPEEVKAMQLGVRIKETQSLYMIGLTVSLLFGAILTSLVIWYPAGTAVSP